VLINVTYLVYCSTTIAFLRLFEVFQGLGS
jgi:hypothetical protein